MHVAPADERIGVGLEARGLELALDRATATGQRRTSRARRRTGSGGGGRARAPPPTATPIGDGHLAGERRASGRVSARHLPLGRRFRGRPHDVGEHPAPAAVGPVLGEQLRHVGEERRGQREVALLVRAPVRSGRPVRSRGDARVEQVALAAEPSSRGAAQSAAAASSRRSSSERNGSGAGGQRELALPRPHTNTTRNRRARIASGSASSTAPVAAGGP